MAISHWDSVVAEARKVLGKDAKIPDKKMAFVRQALAEEKKAADSFRTMRESAQKQLLADQNLVSNYRNLVVQLANDLLYANFGLDPGKPEEKKKITQAREEFKKFIQDLFDYTEDTTKQLVELRRHLANADTYKCS